MHEADVVCRCDCSGLILQLAKPVTAAAFHSQSCQKGLCLLGGKILEVEERKTTQFTVVSLITEGY